MGADSGVVSRSATWADLTPVTETISLAFHDDPTWSWAFPDPDRRQAQYAVFWRLMVAGALRYPWVLTTERCEAASVWLPPGGTELSEEDEAQLEPILSGAWSATAPARCWSCSTGSTRRTRGTSRTST